jgi:hypothetical protein
LSLALAIKSNQAKRSYPLPKPAGVVPAQVLYSRSYKPLRVWASQDQIKMSEKELELELELEPGV